MHELEVFLLVVLDVAGERGLHSVLLLSDVLGDDVGDVFDLFLEFGLFREVVLGFLFDQLFVLLFLAFEHSLLIFEDLNFLKLFSDGLHILFFEADHFL